MYPIHAPVTPLLLGSFTSPPAIVATLLVLLVVIIVGRFLLGVAWKLVVVGLLVVVALWALGALGTVLNLIG